MTIKDKIILDLKNIENPGVLNQLFDFMQILKGVHAAPSFSNKEEVLKFAGEISDEEAKALTTVINTEFNNIEGEW